ncbi:MAG: hypothetical protein Kow00102_05710 [Spirochaetota bacterium]|nr:hypothetical protein [Spirochaetota bacterium]
MSDKEVKDVMEEKKEIRQVKKTFDELVKENGLQPAVARALRTMVKVQNNGLVSAGEFARALKQFNGMRPK